MKVLFVSSSSGSRGGGEIYLLYLGSAMRQQGHDVVLWASSDKRMDELAEGFSEFGTVVRTPYRNTYDRPLRGVTGIFRNGVARDVARQWESIDPDVIHLNKQNLEDGLELLQAANLTSIPSVCTIHITQSASFLKARFAWLRDWAARRALNRYEGPFVAVQERRGRELRQFLGEDARVNAINNGVQLYDLPFDSAQCTEMRRRFGIGDDELLFVGVGRIEPQKRPLFFLDVARRIYAECPAARFLWVGDGSLRGTWEEKVDDYDLHEVVHCAGWQEDVEPFLAAADVFLHVAEFEGLPLALIEAMSAGLPCALPESLVEDFEVIEKEHVLVIDEWEAFVRAIRDSDRRQEVALRGRQLVENELSVEHMARQYEVLYHSVIGSTRS